ncbi:reverse transcriptase domain-containing protein [Tanacetum coccineum]
MLVEVGKFIFHADFVILEMEEDSKVPFILGRPILHTADALIRVKQKQLNLGVGTERMIFNINSVMKHSYSNDDTCFSIDIIDEILEEDFDALLDEGSKILHSVEGTLLEEEIFAEFDEFMVVLVVVTKPNDELVPTRTITGPISEQYAIANAFRAINAPYNTCQRCFGNSSLSDRENQSRSIHGRFLSRPLENTFNTSKKKTMPKVVVGNLKNACSNVVKNAHASSLNGKNVISRSKEGIMLRTQGV